jgi:hypothetical protein
LQSSRQPVIKLVRITAALALAAGALVPTSAAFANAGEVTHLSGAVVARKADGRSQILGVISQVQVGDVVATAENAYARVKFSDGTEAVLRPATQVKIEAFSFQQDAPQKDNVVLSLLKGGMRSVTGLLARRNPANFRVATPSATIGIRGTHFGATYCNNDCSNVPGGGSGAANGLHVDVADGQITLTNAGGTLTLGVGQFGHAPSPTAPPVIVPPTQGIKFTPPPAMTGPGGVLGIGKAGGLECSI